MKNYTMRDALEISNLFSSTKVSYHFYIICALKRNPQLLELPDYKRLYDEFINYCLDNSYWDTDTDTNREWSTLVIEDWSDLANKLYKDQEDNQFTLDAIELCLKRRKKHWKENTASQS